MKGQYGYLVMLCAVTGVVGLLTGCASTTHTEVSKPTVVEYVVPEVPGAVEYAWEEPMVDVVDVPPGLDPEGHYYRPAHREIVEIRQGRWQYYKRPSR